MTDTTNAPSLADVLERLDRLEAALHRLIEVTASRASAPAVAQAAQGGPAYQPQAPTYSRPPERTAPVPSPAGSPGGNYSNYADAAYRPPDQAGAPTRPEPPIIEVAPPSAPQYQQHASPGTQGLALEPRRDYDPYGFRTDIEVPPPSATIQQVLAAVFEAGLRAEPEDTWAIMTKLTHASQMVGPRALDHFKAFAWHKLRRTASSYLRNNDPTTFSIAYTDPAQPTPEVDRVRVFVKAGDNRMPVPVAFARDASQQNAWRLTMISL